MKRTSSIDVTWLIQWLNIEPNDWNITIYNVLAQNSRIKLSKEALVFFLMIGVVVRFCGNDLNGNDDLLWI